MIFGTGYWALGTGGQAQHCNGQENPRFPDAVRLTELGPMPMIAGSSQLIRAGSHSIRVRPRR